MMDWAEDFKFSLKKSAKKGRRANANSSSTTLTSPSSHTVDSSLIKEKPDSGGTSSSSNNITILSDEPGGSEVDDYLKLTQRGKRSGGWADETIKTSKLVTTNVIEQERFSSISNTTHFSEDDIPIIPDLEDIQDEVLMDELVEAPVLAENRTATYKELNSDLLKHAAFAALDDVDLSILDRCLESEEFIAEADEEWTWDKLFIEVSSDIHAEKPKSADAPKTQYVN